MTTGTLKFWWEEQAGKNRLMQCYEHTDLSSFVLSDEGNLLTIVDITNWKGFQATLLLIKQARHINSARSNLCSKNNQFNKLSQQKQKMSCPQRLELSHCHLFVRQLRV